jgi:hypothetical protein
MFLQSFYHESMLNFAKGFFCIYWDDDVVFVLNSIYVLYYVYLFAYIAPSLHPWNENLNTHEYNAQELWDIIKRPNLRIHGVEEGVKYKWKE